MSEPLALATIEDKIQQLVAELERCISSTKKRWEEDAAADTAYDIAFAQAYLQAKEGALPGQEKADSDLTAKQRATLVCAEALTRRNASHALLESAREAARNYRASLDALRTLSANVRELTVGA